MCYACIYSKNNLKKDIQENCQKKDIQKISRQNHYYYFFVNK